MTENNYQITIPYKDYKNLKEMEIAYKSLQNDISACFEKKYALLGKPIPIHINQLIKIGKKLLPIYCKNCNFVEV